MELAEYLHCASIGRDGGPTPQPNADAHDIMQIIRIRTAYWGLGEFCGFPGQVRIVSRIMFMGVQPATDYQRNADACC
ncbi:MAG TPA: hypothetical protein DEF05_07935 [Erwinia sp.]|nr:hypothetical protein [Erwinia sp.]